jgi:hypothetical protein
MIAFILVGIILLLIAWLMRRQARRQIGPSLSGRILYTDTEANRETLTSDRYNLSGKPDYILEERGELIPVERKSRAIHSRGPYNSERLQLAAYCLLVEERYGNPCAAVGCNMRTARWISPSTRRCARHSSRACERSNNAVRSKTCGAVTRVRPAAAAAGSESSAPILWPKMPGAPAGSLRAADEMHGGGWSE